jgi:arylamine N-acetyltransferase
MQPLDSPSDIAAEQPLERYFARGRGGHCFEQNGLLRCVPEALVDTFRLRLDRDCARQAAAIAARAAGSA